MKALVIHGHFYQPPRENPWTGTIDREPSAHPFANWNERIHSESYRPNAFARIVDASNRVEQIANNYHRLSFNYGPTLLSWLEQHDPITYARILLADRQSVGMRSGHGNAIAQGYNHAILPLCNDRDRVTQIRWGLADFRYRFGREPESLWLPETACDDATLGTLIDEGLKYVILSPYQAERARPLGGTAWHAVGDGSIDPGVAYAYRHRDGSGRTIALFFYDGPCSRAIAFDGALASSQALVDRISYAQGGKGRLIHLATDGESYGHHTRFGDRTLAYALEREAPRRGFTITNYGEYLAHNPPTYEVELKAGSEGKGTSWSCAHGVGRWFRDCGCETGGQHGWNQAWRGPLRRALDLLRDAAAAEFQATELFGDPWAARDAYIERLLDPGVTREAWLYRHAARSLSPDEQVRALTLLEIQRHAMLMYTSCGWFFNDISGIETQQILKYAGRVMDLMRDIGQTPPQTEFLELLAQTKSNHRSQGTGADVYHRSLAECRVTPSGIAAHLAITGLAGAPQDSGDLAGYRYECRDGRKDHRGRLTMATSHIVLEARATGRRAAFAVAALHLGEVDFYCALKPFPGDDAFAAATGSLWAQFPTASLPGILRAAQDGFGPAEFGLDHVLADGKKRIAETVFGDMVSHFSEQHARLYDDNRRMIEMLQNAHIELPGELRAAAEFALGRRFEQEVRRQRQSLDPADYQQAIELAKHIARQGYQIDRSFSRRMFESLVTNAVRVAAEDADPEGVETALRLMSLCRKLQIELSLERAQELVYEALTRERLKAAELPRLAERLGLAPILVPTLTHGEPGPRAIGGSA